MIVGRTFVWSVHVVESTPLLSTPGPTIPSQVLPISSWKSPWFHAKPGLTQGFAPQLGVNPDAVMKKSALPNSVNVGVRCGSAVSMCSAFSSTGSAKAWATCTTCPLLRYGSGSVRFARLCSSERTLASVRAGLPFTYTVGASSEWTKKSDRPVARRRSRLTSPIWFDGQAVSTLQFACVYASEPSGCGVPTPPAKWSPSSTVNANSVLLLLIPSFARRSKNCPNAVLYAASCALYVASPGPAAELANESLPVLGTWMSCASEI